MHHHCMDLRELTYKIMEKKETMACSSESQPNCPKTEKQEVSKEYTTD